MELYLFREYSYRDILYHIHDDRATGVQDGMRQKFDIPGFITSAVFLPVFLYGLSEVTSSTNTKGWSSPLVLGCMWVAVVSFVLFLYTELTVKHPMINLKIFQGPQFLAGEFDRVYIRDRDVREYFSDSFVHAGFAGVFGLPDGFVLPACGFLQAVASPLAGNASRWVNPKVVIVLGLFLLCTSFYMNYSFSFLTDKWYIMISLYLRGVGLGILYPPLLNVSLRQISNRQMAQASSVTNIVRQIGEVSGWPCSAIC